MIVAEIVLDIRYKTKKGYPVKIRVYDTLNESKVKYKYHKLGIFQNRDEVLLTADLKRRSLQLDDEVKFCNDNHYLMDEAIEIIKNGLPVDDLEMEIAVLRKRLELLEGKKAKQEEKMFIAFVEDLIKERQIKKLDVKAYTSIKGTVKSFIAPAEDFRINDIDREWLIRFDLFNKEKKNLDSTIYMYISMIKTIFTEAQSRPSLNIKSGDPFHKVKSKKSEKKTYDLTVEDLKKLLRLKTEDIKTTSKFGASGIKRIADLFLFQFAIGGHDMVEIASIKWTNIVKGRLVFGRRKNRFRNAIEPVNVMISPFAKKVITKYGDKTSDRIFPFLPDPETQAKEYNCFIANLNLSIYKIIRRAAHIENDMKSKTTRYVFRTLAGNLLINDFVVMKIQGHKPQGITFGYQGALNHEVQDREHQKILDLVFDDKCQ